MGNMWDGFFDGIDFKDLDREPGEKDLLRDFFWDDEFDERRGYIRKIMQAHPEITDRDRIDAASEQMYESHMEGVELDAEDALRFAANDKPVPTEKLMKMLYRNGLNDSNVFGLIGDALNQTPGATPDGVKGKGVKAKARLMTAIADLLAENPDVLILGLPTFDPEQNWTQVKLALFSENLSNTEKNLIAALKNRADASRMRMENGTAVVMFRIENLWQNYGQKRNPETELAI